MPAVAELIDDFAAKNEAKWQHAGGGAWNAYENISSGALALTCRTAYDAHLESVANYDMTNSAMVAEITSRPAQGGDNSTEMYFGFNNSVDDTDNATFILTGSGGWVIQVNVNNVEAYGAFGTYSTTAHRWLRIRHRGTKLYFEGSPDGRTWAIMGSVAKPAGLDITSVKPQFQCGYYGTQATPGTAGFDNFNIAPYCADVLTCDTGQASANTCGITTTAEYPANTSIVVMVGTRNGNQTTTDYTVTDSAGNAYALDESTLLSAGTGWFMFSTHNIKSALASGSTITCTGSSAVNKIAAVAANVTNLLPSGAKDISKTSVATGAASGSNGTYSTGASSATTQAAEIVFGGAVLNIDATGTIANTTNWATTGQANTTGGTNTTNARAYMQHRVLTATGAQTSNPTGTSRAFRAGLVSYKIKPQAPADKFFAMF